MDTTIYPQKNQDIRLDLPCSKSLAHRYIIASCLAQEKSTIGNITLNQDIEATIETMRHLGAKITYNDHCLEIEGITSWQYDGCELDCHESGSTLRFLIPLCTLIAEDVCLTGTLRLLARPQDVYEKLFAENNVKFVKEKDKLIVGHGLKGGHYRLDGNISSQFITGLLFVLPLLKEDSYLEIIEPFASRSYVDLTMQVLQQFNVDVAYVDHNHIKIKGNQRYQAGNHLVEADYSQLAFFAALGILNNGLEVGCFDEASKQGDKAVIDILRKMGADIHFAKGYYHFKPSQLQGCQIDLED
ncbi:MAG: 3-phosphoshikimate 1-carboxyvinyltransferase, partial [Erysipelotrichaceae bacterium]|nr:3-phosphoshikimate 1-carboxyvinyltransferase [Erysipelotrichaceae bacterium]